MEESMDKMENIRTSPKESSRKDVNSKGIISPILLGEPLTTSDLPPIPIRYRMLLKNLVTCFKDSFLNQQSSVHQKIREHDLTFKWWSLKFWKKHGWIVFFLEPKALSILWATSNLDWFHRFRVVHSCQIYTGRFQPTKRGVPVFSEHEIDLNSK